MTLGGDLFATLRGRLHVGLALLLIALAVSPAKAVTLNGDGALCHAISDRALPDAQGAGLHFSCRGTPAGYHDRSLWLRTDPARLSIDRRDVALLVHQSRFDRLAVAFTYADGQTRWQQVRQGDYGAHWRAGGQILFEAPERSVALTAITMRFDGLSSFNLVRARLLPKGEAVVQSTGMAVGVGAALTLLLVSGIYSLSLAVAVRRQYLAWQAAWSATMLIWGALWSQAHLALFPSLAGTVSAQIATLLSCLAIAVATASAVLAIGRSVVPRWLRATALALGALVGAIGVPLALIRSEDLTEWGDVLGLIVMADLIAVVTCLVWAWRRGSVEARDFLAAWCLPIAVLAFIHIVDVDDSVWGGGSKLLVLAAATWQALWLSASATRRLAQLRVERDSARASEALAQQLARRDPLTALLNRRGFVESVTPLLERARADDLPAALLLVDIDHFKSINDVHGHDAGDAVLSAVGQRIARWEGAMCTAARLGGEEFGLLTVGMEGMVLARFAESVRLGIAACDHREAIGDRIVTASVGVAEVRPASDFQQLYRLADEALYDAKRAGRDCVVIQRSAGIARLSGEGTERASAFSR